MKLPQLNKSALRQRLQWIFDPVGYFGLAAQKCPDIFATPVFGSDIEYVFVNHPAGIQQILSSDRHKFTAPGEYNHILRPIVGDASVIMLSGDRHKKRRKLLLPPFHGERMQAYGQLICQLTKDVIKQLPVGKPFIARKTAQEISLQVILSAVYGLSEKEDRYREIQQHIKSVTDVFNSPLTSAFLFIPLLQKDLGAWSPWGHFIREQQKVDRSIYAEIADKKAENLENRQDILSLMMSARDEAGQPMSEVELHDELMTLMFAGHETTATAISWGLYWTHRYPEIKAKILAEINSLGAEPDPMAIAKLPYLDAVCRETLRIYPVAMLTFPRVPLEPIEVLGYTIEPGQIVMGNMYMVHQREDIYPQHEQFKPERFLAKQFSQYEFFPFGGGTRRCIGEALAQLELKLVIATILTHFELTLASGRPEKPQRRGVTLAPNKGVKMIFQGAHFNLPSYRLSREGNLS